MNKLVKVALLSTLVSMTSWAQEHDAHHHHEAQPSELKLNQGKKWAIDDSLHTGMTGIKKLIAADVDAIHVNNYSPVQYKQLAEKLDLQLNYLFKNCKLPADADAQLHVLLAKVMQASHQMKQDTKQKSGVISVIKAMKEYEKYFDDPNWQPLIH